MLIDDYVSARDKNRLMASCDCYLSLHRSEGLGLTMAEAMGFAVPVVATGYSGNSDFLSERTGFPVAYELAPVGACAAPYPADARWAEPDVDDAARLLRLIFEDRAGAAEVAARGRDEIRRRYSPVAVGAVVEERLRAINALRPIHGTRGVPTDWRAAARHARRLRALRTQIAAGEQTTRAGAAE
jgi:glycosyltransferase involved in cell wall biosynthesis